MAERKTLSKTVRFEVFKRDGFKCQYCGAAAPDVLLQIDHIQPLAAGGTGDIINLLTACGACNGGKGARRLDDNTAIAKQRAQLEELQERREQLEMLLDWKQELNDLKEDTVSEIEHYWQERAPGFSLNDNGRRNLKKWLRRFQVDELLHAMDVAAEQYLQFTKEGTVTGESWELGFSKVPGICRVERASREDPEVRELYYIRGIARNKCSYFKSAEALELLKTARSWDVSLDALRAIALNAKSWTRFCEDIYDAINDQKRLAEPLPPAPVPSAAPEEPGPEPPEDVADGALPAGKMTAWLCEKSTYALEVAADLCEWARVRRSGLTPSDNEYLGEALKSVVTMNALIVAFAKGNLACMDEPWHMLISVEGRERVTEFLDQLAAPVSNPPGKWPYSLQRIHDAILALRQLVEEQPGNCAVVRGAAVELGLALGRTKVDECRSLGAELTELIDRQCVRNEIEWEDFLKDLSSLLTDVLEVLEEYATLHQRMW